MSYSKTIRLSTALAAIIVASTGAQAEEATARGVVKALTEATVAMDYTARIKKLPKRDGQSFKAGEVLIVFDCRKYVAEVNAARAGVKAKELAMINNRKLLERGAIGANEVKISEAEFNQVVAEVSALQSRTGSCDFKAPFDGILVERIAQEHESPAASQPLIKIVDTTRLEVEAIVPSKWLAWMKLGQKFSFVIDETGAQLPAEILRMGAVVDPVSQTIKVYGVLKKKDSSVLPGMSGTATFASVGS